MSITWSIYEGRFVASYTISKLWAIAGGLKVVVKNTPPRQVVCTVSQPIMSQSTLQTLTNSSISVVGSEYELSYGRYNDPIMISS